MTDTFDFLPLTRARGIARIAAFQPAMGRSYAATRNHDHGPGARTNVSLLSPWTRRRLVLESEIVAAALSRHSAASAEKFIQEVFWRTYFKGWLEQRPSVWASYRDGVRADLGRIAGDRALARRVAAAIEGRTGIDCFDAWARELVATGYLHNHARMWFASIWIFTLRLPWRLGADFFLRHLLDGDPASNTLSWRWVAGLHTVGKTYAALSSNIAIHTGGRFPETPGLAREALPLDEGGLPPAGSIRRHRTADPQVPSLLVLTEDDCHPESLGPLNVAAVATLRLTPLRSPGGAAECVHAADREALADAARRSGRKAESLEPDAGPEALVDLARAAGARQIVTAFVPVGWTRDWFDDGRPVFERAGLAHGEILRDWDRLTWPHARAGFFKVKQKIPAILRALNDAPVSLPLFAAAQQPPDQ